MYILAAYGGGYAVLMSMQIANTAGYTKRSVGSSGMFVGYCLGMVFIMLSLYSTDQEQATSSVLSFLRLKRRQSTTPAGSRPL